MAITNSRIQSKNITTLINRDFISSTDRSKDVPPNAGDVGFVPETITSKLAAKIGKKNVFEVLPITSTGSALISLGIHPDNNDPRCPSVGKSNIDVDDRLLNTPNNSKFACPTTSGSSLSYDTILKAMTQGLPEYMIKTLESSIGGELQRAGKHIDGLVIDKSRGIINGVNKTKKALSEIGDPISQKLHLKQLLSCPKNGSLSPGDSSMVLDIVIAGLLAQAICISPEKMVRTIIDIATSGIADKGSILKGIVNTFSGLGDSNPADKVKILAESATGLGGLTGTDRAITRSYTNKFLSSLSNTDADTKAPSEEHANMMTALNSLDDGWSIDERGNSNVSATKGNKYLTTLSSKKLLTRSRPASEISVTVEPDTGDDRLAKLIMLTNNSSKIVSSSEIGIPGY